MSYRHIEFHDYNSNNKNNNYPEIKRNINYNYEDNKLNEVDKNQKQKTNNI
jgi:hypothetical protein